MYIYYLGGTHWWLMYISHDDIKWQEPIGKILSIIDVVLKNQPINEVVRPM